MRWRAPAQSVDNACALPTARAFDHMPTAFDHDQIKKEIRAADYAARAPHCVTAPLN
jgi:hypothetical protein